MFWQPSENLVIAYAGDPLAAESATKGALGKRRVIRGQMLHRLDVEWDPVSHAGEARLSEPPMRRLSSRRRASLRGLSMA